MINFDQLQKYNKFQEREHKALTDSAWFCRKSERMRKAILEKPPYMLYRVRCEVGTVMKDFIGMIEVYNEPESDVDDSPIDVMFYCPKEWNPLFLKDRRYMQVKLHELEPIVHRRIAQLELSRKGIPFPGIRYPLQRPEREKKVIL